MERTYTKPKRVLTCRIRDKAGAGKLEVDEMTLTFQYPFVFIDFSV